MFSYAPKLESFSSTDATSQAVWMSIAEGWGSGMEKRDSVTFTGCQLAL